MYLCVHCIFQSPTSTTMEQQQCAGSSGSTTSNDSEKDSSVLTQTNGSASFAHSVPETPPQSCSQNNTLSAALISGSVDIEPSPDDENATGGRNNCSKYEDSNSKIIAKEKDHSLEGVEDDSGRENAVAAADTGEAEPDPETEADSIQEQLDALMAASSKISRNTVKCPRKHRQLIKVRPTTTALNQSFTDMNKKFALHKHPMFSEFQQGATKDMPHANQGLPDTWFVWGISSVHPPFTFFSVPAIYDMYL